MTDFNQTSIEEYSLEVINFFNEVEFFYSFYNDSLGWQKYFSYNEILNIAQKYYNVIYYDFIGYYYYFLDLHQKWKEEVIANNYMVIHEKPAIKLKRIRQKIAEYKSFSFAELLQVPFLLRVKIIRMENSFYYSENGGLILDQNDMVVQIKDVLKGEYSFTKFDTIKISYLNEWYNFSNNHFKSGKDYLIPFKPWRIENKNNYYYGVYSLPDNNYAVYPIINDSIRTPGNFFGVGEITQWNDFKNYFIENFIIEESLNNK